MNTTNSRFHHVGGVLSAVVVSMVFLSACGSTPEPLRVPVAVMGSPDMNSGGNAAVVRIYQLSSSTSFRQAPVESFWQDDEAVLGTDLVAPRVHLLLYPNEQEEVTLEIHDDARYIGVAVDLRDPEADHWRQLLSVEALHESQPFALQVGERRLLLAGGSS